MQILGRYGRPSEDGEGVVRVCVNGERGAVCDSGWNYDSARVACVSAGYSQHGKKNSSINDWSEKLSFFSNVIIMFLIL